MKIVTNWFMTLSIFTKGDIPYLVSLKKTS